jgi:hypothetical protein
VTGDSFTYLYKFFRMRKKLQDIQLDINISLQSFCHNMGGLAEKIYDMTQFCGINRSLTKNTLD